MPADLQETPIETTAENQAEAIVEWDIKDLKPHPRQKELFTDLSAHELKRLRMDIKNNGLENPPEILPDGTIITGHQRIRAMKRLHRVRTPVIVRHDLAEAGDQAVEKRLINENLNRRHLHPIEIARCYRALKEQPSANRGQQSGDVRDQLAKRFGKSGRTLDRYERVLDTPLEVQNAVIAGKLSMGLAEQVAGLNKQDQVKIVNAIVMREDPKKVIAQYVSGPRTHHVTADDAIQAFSRSLAKGYSDLQGRVAEINRVTVEKEQVLPVLRQAQGLLSAVIDHLTGSEEASEAEYDSQRSSFETETDLDTVSGVEEWLT